jgi:peptide/nickel transport system substrate-binding protein
VLPRGAGKSRTRAPRDEQQVPSIPRRSLRSAATEGPMRRVLLVLAFAAAAGCGDGSKNPAAPAPAAGGGAEASGPKGTLVFARAGDSKYLDPAIVTDGESVKVTTNLFDTLIRFKPGSTELAPGLATSWESSKDGLTWTFKLRDAKFHDGSPVDADAVVFSFLRQKDKDHPAHVGEFAYWDSFFGMVESVRAADPHTVEIKLTTPTAPFEATMGLFSMSIVSPAAWASEGKGPDGKFKYDFKQKPVGSGPFRFKSWTRDDTVVLEANPGYWDGPPKVAKLIFKTIKDNSQRLLALESGQADVMDGLNPEDIGRVKGSKDVVLAEQPGLNIAYFAMNNTRKPFDDPRVRNALALAIDKETLKRTAYSGVGEIAVTPVPKGMLAWKEMKDRGRDVAKAKALLAEAGLANGFKFTLLCGDTTRTYMPRPKDAAIQIQQDLKAIGVTAEISVLEFQRLLTDVENSRHDACLLGWMADFGDPDNFLYMLLDKETAKIGTSNNAAFYTDETVHGWLTKARETTDHAERVRLYGLAQDKIFADAPMVPLMQMPDVRAHRANVKGYRIYPVGGEYLASVSVE